MHLRSNVSLKRIHDRLSLNMAPYKTDYKTCGSGGHDTIIVLPAAVQSVMDYISGDKNKKFLGKIRAEDMRHVLLLMPFVLQDLLKPEVDRWNARSTRANAVEDPSNSLVDIVCDLLEWYSLFRYPEHTAESIADLDIRGRTLIGKCIAVFPKVKTIKVTDHTG